MFHLSHQNVNELPADKKFNVRQSRIRLCRSCALGVRSSVQRSAAQCSARLQSITTKWIHPRHGQTKPNQNPISSHQPATKWIKPRLHCTKLPVGQRPRHAAVDTELTRPSHEQIHPNTRSTSDRPTAIQSASTKCHPWMAAYTCHSRPAAVVRSSHRQLEPLAHTAKLPSPPHTAITKHCITTVPIL